VTDATPDLADVQGNILRGYRKHLVRHLVLSVRDRHAVGNWLLDATGRDLATHQITNAEPWDESPSTCLNIAMTPQGLSALNVDHATVETFPPEFVAGMASRATKIGDVGESAPEHWKPEWRSPELHLMVSVFADVEADRDSLSSEVLAIGGGRAFGLLATLDGAGFPGGLVHFGYRDSISQPRFMGVREVLNRPDRQPLVEIGAALLGYPTPIEDVVFDVPKPEVLGFNGSFSAFRVLEQRVAAFEEFLTTSAATILASSLADEVLPAGIEKTWLPPVSRLDAMRELVAAKVLGRWRNGVPIEMSPHTPTPQPPITEERLNDFAYQQDADGLVCPMASHMRRSNPRDARIVQRSTNHSRRIVRRGIPYGPQFDPAQPDLPDDPDKVERGLLGAFIGASLLSQFESIQYDWINLGLLDPRITGTNDVIVGNNDPAFSCFALPVGDTTIELRGFSRFIVTRGGAYLFIPSLPAIRYLGQSAA